MTAGGGRAPPRAPPAGALAARPAISPTSGPISLLLRTLFTVTKPIRMLIAFNLLMGRSLQRLAAAIARGALLAAGWLYGRVAQRSSGLNRFERHYRIAPRRWHVVLGELSNVLLPLSACTWEAAGRGTASTGECKRRAGTPACPAVFLATYLSCLPEPAIASSLRARLTKLDPCGQPLPPADV